MAGTNAQKGSEAHQIDVLLQRHVQTSGENGACLTGGHEGDYKADNSCSHRWQAYRHAEDIAGRYNWPAYKDIFALIVGEARAGRAAGGSRPRPGTTTSPYRRYSGQGILRSVFSDVVKQVFNKRFPTRTYRATANDEADLDVDDFAHVWDLDKSVDGYDRDSSFGPIPNFRDLARIPYWHQSHHLIPSAEFRNALLEMAGSELNDVYFLARKGLLEAKYNHNDKVNMIILPMQDAVADALRLPVHTTAPEHDSYSRRIRAKIQEVLQNYAGQIALSNHDEDVPAFTKAQLTSYSQQLFDRIANGTFVGQTLDQLSDTFFDTNLPSAPSSLFK